MRTVSQQYINPHQKQREYDKYQVPIERTNSLAVNAQNMLAYQKHYGNHIYENPYHQNNSEQQQQVSLGNVPLTSSHIVGNNQGEPRKSNLRYLGNNNQQGTQSAENIAFKDRFPPVYQNVRGSQQNVKIPHNNNNSVSFGNNHYGPVVTKNVYVYDEEDEGDKEENNFLNHIQKVQDLMGKSVQQMKFEIQQERKQKEMERKLASKKKYRASQFQCVSGSNDHHGHQTSSNRRSATGSNSGMHSKGSMKTGSRNSSNSGRQYGKKVNNRDISFRIDYFHKLEASFSQVRIVYGMFKKNEKPNPEHTTKYFDIHPHLRIYIKEQYQHMVPSSDLYMYVEIQAYQKSMSELIKYWTIIPVYNDMLYLNQGLWKLYFFDQKYTPQMLLEDAIKPSMSTNLLVKICMTRSEIDNDITQAHTEYYMPYLHDHEKRMQEKQMRLDEEQRKQLELERQKQEKKQQNKLERADLRVQNSNDIITQIEDELKELQGSDLPYIKNRQYRKTKYNEYDDIDDSYIDPVNGSVISKSSYYSQFQNQDKTQYQPKRLRPKNWPPQRVTKDDIKDFQIEQQTIRLKPMYLYQMSGLHYNFDPRRSVAFTYQTKYESQNNSHYKTKYTDQPVNFGPPLHFNKFEDNDKEKDTLNYINSRNYPIKQGNINVEDQNNHQNQQTGGFPTLNSQENQQNNNNQYQQNNNNNQSSEKQQQQSQMERSSMASIQRSESKKPTQQSQISRHSQQETSQQQQESQQQSQQETPAEKLDKISGTIKIQIKTMQLKNYKESEALGADKMVVGPGGPINDVNGEECQAQAEDLTEKAENDNMMIFDEHYQDFLIDIDQFKRMHQDIKELYLILQFMGENDDNEFCHGWTFIRIVDQNIGELKNGVFENPLYKEPVVPNSPYEESSYTKMEETVTFDIRCTQVQ